MLKSRDNAGALRTPTFFVGNDIPPLFRLNIDEDNRFVLSYKTSRNRFIDYIDNKGENVPEKLKRVFTCVDFLSCFYGRLLKGLHHHEPHNDTYEKFLM